MKKTHNYYVYIVTNWRKTTLYTGVTNNLPRRLAEHYRNRGKPKTFAGRYYCYNLVFFEWHRFVNNVIYREKEIKLMRRSKKEQLIEEMNPEWAFLNQHVCGVWPPKKVEEGVDK